MEARGSKFINHKYISFSESCQEKKGKELEIKILETMVKKTQLVMEVPIMDTSSTEGMIIKIYDYHLIRDKVSREIVSSQRDNYTDLKGAFVSEI